MICLKEMDNLKIVEAELLDVSAAFDIIHHNLLLRKHMFNGFSTSAILWIQNYLSHRTHRVFFNGSLCQTHRVWCTAGQLSRPSTLFYFFLPMTCHWH
jgi:hypothetical protein